MEQNNTGHDFLQPMWFQGPLIPANVAVEDDGLPSDDAITSSDSETEQDMWHLMKTYNQGVILMMIKHLLVVVSHDWK